MQTDRKPSEGSSTPSANWYVVALVIVVLGVLGAYMTLQRAGTVGPEATGAAAPEAPPVPTPYTQTAEIPTGLQQPRAIVWGPEGRLYVAGDEQVRVFRAGALEGEFPLSGKPHCLTLAPEGTIYVGYRDRVAVYDGAGRPLGEWESWGPRAFLTSLVTDETSIWVADAGNRVVLRCNRQGQVLARLGETAVEGGLAALVVPSPYLAMAKGPGDVVYLVNPGEHTVNTLGPDGQWRGAWGQAGGKVENFTGCCNPTHLAVLPNGHVVTAEKGIPRVKEYTAEGELDSLVAGPDLFRPETAGLSLATDSQGSIYVLDPTRRAVRVFQRVQESHP